MNQLQTKESYTNEVRAKLMEIYKKTNGSRGNRNPRENVVFQTAIYWNEKVFFSPMTLEEYRALEEEVKEEYFK